MDPSMVKLAQDMMAGMSPEQIRQMQEQASKLNPSQVQQAMDTMKNMTPEQRAQVERMAKESNPDDLLRQSQAHVSAQQTNAGEQLKNEGNALFKSGRYAEAVDKYQRALENVTTGEGGGLVKKSCHSNLASCYLHLEQWSKCVNHCNAVLEIDGGRSMKALYRRGQAYIGLKKKSNAVADLERALVLAGPEDGVLIEEKLRIAKALDVQVEKTVIEEVDMVEETIIEEVDGAVEEETVAEAVTTETVHGTETTAGAAYQQNMFVKDPESIKNAAKMLQDMDPETVEQMMKMSGAPPGMTVDPEQLKMAAKMMENMSAEDIQRMQDMSRAFASSTPSSSNGTAAQGAPTMPSSMDDMRKMAQNPEMLKHMQQMLKGMDPESLCTMMKSAGVNVSPEQAKKMQDQLSSLSDTQVERLAKVANVIGTAVSYYQRLKAYIRQNPAMVFAIIVLIIAVYLRYKGII
ncbi:Outer envelope protein 61 [Picochlorum sp. SENEW3]|nr:Outer envelope protein 61 [Picochlorum sp. SENEW3]